MTQSIPILWNLLSTVNNIQNLVACKGSRKNLVRCMSNIGHASRNRLSSSSMCRAAAVSAWRNELTYKTNSTNESFFVQITSQNSLTNSTCCETSLTISDDFMGRASSFSCTTSSCSFSESWAAAFQTQASTARLVGLKCLAVSLRCQWHRLLS